MNLGTKEIPIKEIIRCQFRDGDLIVIKCSSPLSESVSKRLRDYVQHHCSESGWNCGVLVVSALDGDFEIGAVSREDVTWVE